MKHQINGAEFYSRREGLKAAKTLVMLMEDWTASGQVALRDIAITFGEAEVLLSAKQYVELAKRALNESIPPIEK
jgi:hypothetical protein